ncbi:MAG: SprT family zinc-dependent metalloprotease [Candidatus Gracilibacteria bacterium]|nr:SprT family zinc-dependent metalloprotease [Candidatus Gracilibacteria bacterium]MDD2909130.1 SprT family zinc-dependent metalloprotease [Candidatus Gracilibacteria bacterium]
MISFTDCKIIRKKTKNARISIKNTGEVIISVPRFCLPSYPKNLFESKKTWIEEKLFHINNTKSKLEGKIGEIQYLGEFYKIKIVENPKTSSIDNENKIISSEIDLNNLDLLESWYKNTAKKYLISRTLEIAENEDFKINKISVRSQISRWGSCSGKNNISLNWRLIKCPENIIDYVIYHELVHTIEKNHSSNFWSKLESYNKNCKESRKWLKVNGGEMFL